MIKRVTKDFETRSLADLKKVGAYKYSLHPSTRATCLAFKILGRPKVYFLDFNLINKPWDDLPQNFKILWSWLIEDDYEFSAHNSFFERCIYDNILVKRLGWPKIHPRQRRCTAAKAAACGLPRNLEGAGEVLKLKIQKDKRGYAAMMATCKPTKQWNDWQKMKNAIREKKRKGHKLTPKQLKWLDQRSPEPAMFRTPETDPEVFHTLYTYCKYDVLTEEQLDQAIPDLIPQEQEIWFQNQKLNWRGLRIDIPTVQKITGLIEQETKQKLQELDELTMGLITKPGSRKSVFEFLELEGISLPDLQKNTVDNALDGFVLSEDMRQVLELRKALTLTSTKKYQAFLQRANPDWRVRDILLYHGAGTGRDTGTGIQPHNFPRGLIKMTKNRPYAAIKNIIECDAEILRILYGDSLGILFSAVLRNMIIPSKGYELFVADFSKVEVAVLWWLADNHPGLKVLRDGLDPYKYMAAANTGKPYIAIADDGPERQLGKAQILGCGFGMGSLKFRKTAQDLYRVELSLEQSKKAVQSYRKQNAAVPELWQKYEAAAIQAIKTGKVVRVGKCKFIYNPGKYYGGLRFLWVELPSGRKLAYADPWVGWRVRQFEVAEINDKGEEIIVTKTSPPTETLHFHKVNSKTKKWSQEIIWGGTWAENITQAVARDLMMPAMLRLEKRGYRGLLMVHDEGITEKPIGEGDVDEFAAIMCEIPRWAPGLPLSAKGWKGPRYRKG